MKNLRESVAVYNATYLTNFSVLNPCSLNTGFGKCCIDDLKDLNNMGGLYLLYDSDMDLLSVYSSINIGEGIRRHFKPDASGNWIVLEKWCSKPQFIVCITGDQSKLYEMDSLKSYLIEKLNPRYNAQGVLRN